MNYKNPKEIETIFNIDITKKNRTIPFVVMRAFYAESKVNELKGNITSRYTAVAKEIGCNRDNVYNLITKAKVFKNDECIKILFEAFKTKENALICEYEKQLKKKMALSKAFKINKMFNDGFVYVHKPKQIEVINKLSNLKLAEFLRVNKVLKHELWYTLICNISDKQWQEVRIINPKMFDKLTNKN